MPNIEKWAELARSFSGFEDAPGLVPGQVDVDQFDDWAADLPSPSSAHVSAKFVLHLWESHRAWASGKFNLGQAIRTWDDTHLRQFQAWASDPILWAGHLLREVS